MTLGRPVLRSLQNLSDPENPLAKPTQIARGSEVAKKMRERDGVRSSRDGGHHACVRADQIVLANELADTSEQSHGLDGQEGLDMPILPVPPGFSGAGGRTRTADPALMRRVLLTN